MNTIKFAPFNEFVTEQHNLETAFPVEKELDGKKYKFYEPCNLNIVISNICQNKCNFCINRENTELCTDDIYYTNLRKTLEFLKDIHCEFTLTGGEPTLNIPRFIKTCEILKEFGLHERTISTTGIGLLTNYKGKPVIQYLADLGFCYNLSISRMSSNDNKNNKIMGGQNITNEELQKIAYFSKINGIELRVSTNLLKESVRSYKDMLKFLNSMSKLGIGTVLFRELVGIQDALKIEPLVEEIKNDRQFSYLKTLTGIFYNVDVYYYKSSLREYLVKCYRTNIPKEKVIDSLSYSLGQLKIGFNGDILLK